MEQRHREHVHPQEMFEKSERFLSSTLSQAAFCQQEDLAYWTFRYWLKKYRLNKALTPPRAEVPTDFISLHIAPSEPASSSAICVIESPSGIIVRFNGPVEAAVLAQLIHAAGD